VHFEVLQMCMTWADMNPLSCYVTQVRCPGRHPKNVRVFMYLRSITRSEIVETDPLGGPTGA
jgi:hypothetical protein